MKQANEVKRKRSASLALFAMTVAVVCLFALDVLTASSQVAAIIPPAEALKVLSAHMTPFPHSPLDPSIDTIVWEIRIPRAIGGVLIGMLLALAGVAFQSLLRNPLADPYMVGVSAGSALGSVSVVLLGGVGLLAGFMQPLAAFAAGLLTMIAVYSMSRWNGRLSTQSFLLTGIVVGTFLWSFLQLSVAIALRAKDSGKAESIIAQQLGSLESIGWVSLLALTPFGVIGLVVLAMSWSWA